MATEAKTKKTKSEVSANAGVSADTSKNLGKGTTANAGAYAESEAGATARSQEKAMQV